MIEMGIAAQALFDQLTAQPQRIPIIDMRTEAFKELRGLGLIDTGQEMQAVAANFTGGPAVVRVLNVNPLHVWIRFSDKGLEEMFARLGRVRAAVDSVTALPIPSR